MTAEEIQELAKAVAAKHSLPPEAVLAVAEQESGFQPWSMRYESTFYAKYVAPKVIGGMAITEGMARATSWGVMQIMGETARELGFAGSSLAELCDPAEGLEYGCRKLAQCYRQAAGLWKKAFEIYNGQGPAAYMYSQRAVERMEKWRTNLLPPPATTAPTEAQNPG
jgi:soluble lytic murein transglycosylase-like protein